MPTASSVLAERFWPAVPDRVWDSILEEFTLTTRRRGPPSRMFSRDGSLKRDLWNNLRDSQVTPYSADSCGGGASHSECPGTKEVGRCQDRLDRAAC